MTRAERSTDGADAPNSRPPEVPGPSAPSAREQALDELRRAKLAGALFVARAWAVIPLVEGSLGLVGYEQTLRWIERIPARKKGGVSILLGERLVSAAYKALPLAGGCLPRSLVQYLLHRRDGTPARFVIGVRRPEGANAGQVPRIEAHAWVESPEMVPTGADTFSPIFDSSGSPRT